MIITSKINYSEWSKGELIKELEKLQARKKYGLVWENKPEDIVEQCKEKLPVLVEDKERIIVKDKEKPNNILL